MSHSVSLLAGFLSIFCGFTYALISNFQKYRVRLSIPFVFSYKLVKRFLRPLSKLRYVISLPPCGGRRKWGGIPTGITQFQSTPSVWRETSSKRSTQPQVVPFQSTPSVWRETACLKKQYRRKLPKFQSTPSVWRETIKFKVMI